MRLNESKVVALNEALTAVFWPVSVLKERSLHSSSFSTEGTFVSASTVPTLGAIGGMCMQQQNV